MWELPAKSGGNLSPLPCICRFVLSSFSRYAYLSGAYLGNLYRSIPTIDVCTPYVIHCCLRHVLAVRAHALPPTLSSPHHGSIAASRFGNGRSLPAKRETSLPTPRPAVTIVLAPAYDSAHLSHWCTGLTRSSS